MTPTEAKARIKHVLRALMVADIPLQNIDKIHSEAYTEVIKETLFENRRF